MAPTRSTEGLAAYASLPDPTHGRLPRVPARDFTALNRCQAAHRAALFLAPGVAAALKHNPCCRSCPVQNILARLPD